MNQSPKVAFIGQQPGHRGFVLSPDEARSLVAKDHTSAQVIYPHLIGEELVREGAPERFVIDIDAPDAMTAEKVAPAAFRRLQQLVLPDRQRAADEERRHIEDLLRRDPTTSVTWRQQQLLTTWWEQWRRRRVMLASIAHLPRYIALSRVASAQRLPVFSFVAPEIRPDTEVVVFALADDYSFGILQSAVHVAWFRERCSRLKGDPRYTTRTVFDTFPWPQAPAQHIVDQVVEVVAELLDFRAERLGQGIPIGKQYDSLRQPGRSRLRDLHEALDRAVLDVYGFDPDEDLLAQILALNLSLAEQEQAGGAVRGPGPQGLANTTRTTWRIEPIHRLM